MKKNFPMLLVLFMVFSLFIVGCSKGKGKTTVSVSSDKTERIDLEDTDDFASEKDLKEETMEPIIVKNQDSAYKGINITFESYIDEKMEYSYFVPEIESKDLNKKIGSWLEAEKSDFIKEADKIYKASNNNWVSNFTSVLTTEQIDEDEMIYSLFFQESIILAGSNSVQKNKGFTFNIKEEKLYSLSDLIEVSEGELENLVLDSIKADSELFDSIDQEVLKESLQNQEEIDFRVYENEIHLLFDAYEVASGNCGALEIAIKEDDIKEYLTKDGKKIFSIIDEDESEKENNEDEIQTEEESEKSESSEEVRLEEGSKGYIALTFDDGPHQTNTPRLLEILDNYGVKATFYILGQNAEYYPGVVNEISKRGHELGNHSYSHPNLTNLSYWGSLEELQLNDNILMNICGQRANTVRPPYGAIDGDVEAAVADNGQRIVTWNVDTEDWKNRDPEIILQNIIETAGPGSIILMHDIHETSVDAVPGVIEYLLGEGYQFVTVSQMP